MKNANPLSALLLPLVVTVSLLFSACGDSKPDASRGPVATSATWYPIKVGTVTVQMQLAISEEEMARGLMGRRDLASNQGMLFTYHTPTRMSFYMKNTPTALDIGFFDATGVLREVYPMYPLDEKPVRSHSNELKYALEMNQGWFKSNGVLPGAKLDVAAVNEAIKARGYEP